MITADDWDKKIRLDETNEYRKLKSLMIDDQECWCAGEGDYKGAGKTECPHTEFFDCELAKCQTPKDKEKLIMGWSVFDHKTPQWLAVSTATAADAAVVSSAAAASTVAIPSTTIRLSRKELNISRLNNDASKFRDPASNWSST
mgnify:CR=1 FL=1